MKTSAVIFACARLAPSPAANITPVTSVAVTVTPRNAPLAGLFTVAGQPSAPAKTAALPES